MTGCAGNLPEYTYYPVPPAPSNGSWQPAVGTVDQAMKACIDSLDDRWRAERSALYAQDALVLTGGVVGASGGVLAAVFSGSASSASSPSSADTSQKAATISAIVAAVGGIVALGSKLVPDPNAVGNIYAHKRKHYDAGHLVWAQYAAGPIPPAIAAYAIARFTTCQDQDPTTDPPSPPAGVATIAVAPPAATTSASPPQP
jgi:hypothetical protein